MDLLIWLHIEPRGDRDPPRWWRWLALIAVFAAVLTYLTVRGVIG